MTVVVTVVVVEVVEVVVVVVSLVVCLDLHLLQSGCELRYLSFLHFPHFTVAFLSEDFSHFLHISTLFLAIFGLEHFLHLSSEAAFLSFFLLSRFALGFLAAVLACFTAGGGGATLLRALGV